MKTQILKEGFMAQKLLYMKSDAKGSESFPILERTYRLRNH